AGHRGGVGQVAAGRGAAAAAGDQAVEFGAVVVHAQAAVELPVLVQVQGVEGVDGGGVGAAVAAGAVMRPGQAGDIRVRRVEVGIGPGAAAHGRLAARVQLLAGEL